MNSHADRAQENKSQSVSSDISQKQSGNESTFQFVDNRPVALAQRKLQEIANNSPQTKQAAQLQAMADNCVALHQKPIQKIIGLLDNCNAGEKCNSANPIQRVISYASGQYTDRQQLVDALVSIFGSGVADRIEYWVSAYENDRGRAQFASAVFRHIEGHLREEGFEAVRGVVAASSTTSSHGPQLPSRPNRDAVDDSRAAMSSFQTGSCTLGRITITYDVNNISFHDRQENRNFHAEDGLIEQFEAFAKSNGEIDWFQARINLTINNFFCSEHTTTKSRAENNCLDQVIKLKQVFKFGHFHVYFKNPYGNRRYMESSIAKLQKAGILVTPFALVGKSINYTSSTVDPASESEDEETEKSSEDNLDKEEQGMLAFLLHTNNCLINAISRPGLGRNATSAELVNIRLVLKGRGFPIGSMLVASPEILDIIRRALGINRGIIVHYQGSEQPSDRIDDGNNPIVIDHRDAHFQERRIVRAKRTSRQ